MQGCGARGPGLTVPALGHCFQPSPLSLCSLNFLSFPLSFQLGSHPQQAQYFLKPSSQTQNSHSLSSGAMASLSELLSMKSCCFFDTLFLEKFSSLLLFLLHDLFQTTTSQLCLSRFLSSPLDAFCVALLLSPLGMALFLLETHMLDGWRRQQHQRANVTQVIISCWWCVS